MARSRAVLTIASFAALLALRCAPGGPPGMRPAVGTFDAGNAVPLKHEVRLLAFLVVSAVGGFAYVMAARPGQRPP